MSKSAMYQQCKIEKTTAAGVSSRVIWGPSEYTVVGKPVKVEEDDGSWTTDWTVVAVFGEPIDEKIVNHNSRAYLRQREASDI